jgi:hypothetical protein
MSLEEVPGLMPALKRLREIKASHGLAAGPDDDPLPFDPATDARPAGPTPATTDPDSPFYEGGNPDPDSEVEP